MGHNSDCPRPLKILVVEDEYLIAIDLLRIIVQGGHEVLGPVASVARALGVLAADRPDGCVLDANLRGEYTMTVARELNVRGVPFVISSAYGADYLAQFAEFSGVMNIGKSAHHDKIVGFLTSLLDLPNGGRPRG